MNLDTNNYTETELRVPGIRDYVRSTVGKLIEEQGYKFKKSNFTFNKKYGKSFEEIMFLFYNYYPLNYSFDFLIHIYNEDIEKIKTSFPVIDHYEPYNRYSLFFYTIDFANYTKLNRTGHHYDLATLDDLIEVTNAVSRTFDEEILPLLNTLTTVNGIDAFFESKGANWIVRYDYLDIICSALIAAKLNGKRDYGRVADELIKTINALETPNVKTIRVIENLYEYLKTI